MVASHRRVSRMTLRLTGQHLKYLSAIGVAVFVAFIAIQPRLDRASDSHRNNVTASCVNGAASESATSPCAIDSRGDRDARASTGAGPFAGADTDVPGHDRFVRHPRDRLAYPDDSAAGLTLAELCAAGLARTEFRCRAGFPAAHATAIGTDATASTGHEIRGRVIAADGLGVPGVSVLATSARLYGDSIEARNVLARYLTETDPGGAYSFTDLPDGEYLIRTSANGPYAAARLAVRAGARNADIVLASRDDTVIAGQVFADTGEPLEGVTVLPIVLGMPSATTDSNGYFQLPIELKPGVADVAFRFQLPGYREQFASLKRHQLHSGDAAALEVVMDAVAYWTAVSGTVTNADGDPLPGRVVQLRPLSERRIYRTTTSNEGAFSFPAVEAPADYRLIVSGAPDHEDIDRRIEVTVEHTYFDIEVEPFEFGEMSGQLVNLDGVPIPDFNLVLRNTASATPNAIVTSDADGRFRIPQAPAGDLVVASQSTPAFLVQGLHLEPGDEQHVAIVLDWGPHELRGVVVDRRGNPVPASRIVLSWTHEADGIRTRATRRTSSDANGHFTFSRLGPGAHALRVDAPGFEPVALNHDSSREGYELTVRLN